MYTPARPARPASRSDDRSRPARIIIICVSIYVCMYICIYVYMYAYAKTNPNQCKPTKNQRNH